MNMDMNLVCVVDDELLNDLLSQWHGWASASTVASGFASVGAMFRQARCSRQYDDANGSLDAHIDSVLMEAVDGVLQSIANPWRAALELQARNLHQGCQVWRSPRLPVCPIARAALLGEARKKFFALLAKADLV